MQKTGFTSPAEGYTEKDTDWNHILLPNRASSEEILVGSDSMIDRGILLGSKVIIDRMIIPNKQNEIVYVRVGDTFLIRQLYFDAERRLFLVPANINCKSIEVTEDLDYQIIGKATFAVTRL